MIENLINTGVRLGLSPEVARALVIQTAKGAAGMVEASDVDPSVLQEKSHIIRWNYRSSIKCIQRR